MLLDMEKLAEEAKDKIIPLAQTVLAKKKDGSIKNDDYDEFEKVLEELAREALVGHKELLDMALITAAISSDPREVKYFTEKHSINEVRKHLISLASQFH